MGSTTFPLYIYELIQAVQRFESEHDKDIHAAWCFQQWLNAIPEEHSNLASMIDDVKVYLELRQG